MGKFRSTIFICILLSLFFSVPSFAPGEPMIPAAYWGSIKYNNGVPVSSGTLEAVVDGVVCGSIAVNNGFYGQTGTGQKLVVQGNNLEPGDTVYFRVNTGGRVINASESVDWQSGDTRPVNLTLQSAGIIGDVNGDGMVGGLDFSALLAAWNKKEGESGYNNLCDFNGDKTTGGLDFSIMLQNWNKSVY
ncbi:dockerin type I domain-containing protein [Pelotomaculum isophthalicicum JI]|uniref:Dockerin type I domain-containing protein n=1 Tax=Pelotomaculum isophthalicicum JI TaxID=947010 RepID=A0A9X4JT30_9FIRM|nr:dockerin type I domain-containing protein [Pelotomaculum isophthalicicum]MDF9406775.1 dockerin type I domain-containing protein [Pelotomaculum isophthalicicum JI]